VNNENWQTSSNEIISDNLEPIRSRLEKRIDKSSVIKTMRDGVRSLSFTGIGAVSGFALGGNIASSLTAAAAGKAAEFGTAYLTGLKQRRSDRAVLDLLVSFDG
jgi:hypothetical protein